MDKLTKNKTAIIVIFIFLSVASVFAQARSFKYENEYSIKSFGLGYSASSEYKRVQHKVEYAETLALGNLKAVGLLDQLNSKSEIGLARISLANRDYDLSVGDADFSISQQTIPQLHLQGASIQIKRLFDSKLLVYFVTGEQNYGYWGNSVRGGGVASGSVTALNIDYKLTPALGLGVGWASIVNRSLTQNYNVNLNMINVGYKATEELAFFTELSVTSRGQAYLAESSFNMPQLNLKTGFYRIDPEYVVLASRMPNWAQDGHFVKGNISLVREFPIFFNYQQYLNLDSQSKVSTTAKVYNTNENWGWNYNFDSAKTALSYSQWLNDRRDFVFSSWSKGSQLYISQPIQGFSIYYRYSPIVYYSGSAPSQNYERQENAYGIKTRVLDRYALYYEYQQINKNYLASILASERPQKNIFGISSDKLQLGSMPVYASGYFSIENANNISGTANRTLTVAQLRIDYQPEQSQLSAFIDAVFTSAKSPEDDAQTIDELKLGREKTEFKFGLSYAVGGIMPLYSPKIETKNGKRYAAQEISTTVVVYIPITLFVDEEESFELSLNKGDKLVVNGNQIEYEQSRILFTLTE